jgi:anti-sigma regulatory factor (Ser/Thr protein kinase)
MPDGTGSEPERVPRGGDELRELAETFRRTVERLQSLVSDLEAAHQKTLEAELEKKRFYREVIRAVTRGKFELVEREELPDLGEPLLALPVRTGAEYAAARRAIQERAEAAGMAEDRAIDLLLAASEAISNAMKHAERGCCELYLAEGTFIVRLTDQGAGIRPEDLAAAILRPGFSTKVSLGMGYDMMLDLCDRVWLSTRPEGTAVQLEKTLQPVPQDPLALWLPSPS